MERPASPELAAKGLLAAWQAGDRRAAAAYANAAAITAMFEIAKESAQAAGPCQQDGATFSCPYFTDSGASFFMRSQGSHAAGYLVVEVTTALD